MLFKKVITKPIPRLYHKWTKWNFKIHPYTNPNTLNTQQYIKISMNTNKVNSFTPEFFSDLNGALDVLKADFEPHLPVILTADDVFSAGVDLKYIMTLTNEEDIRRYFVMFNTSLERLYLLDRPTCAALYGPAVAGGLVLAFACDYRVVDQSNTKHHISLRGGKLGLSFPSVAWEILRSAVPTPHPFYELLARGDQYNMDEAFEEHLITACADSVDDIERCACDLLAVTSTKNTHEPFVYMKKLLKEKELMKSRENGSALKRDTELVKRFMNPEVRTVIQEYVSSHFLHKDQGPYHPHHPHPHEVKK